MKYQTLKRLKTKSKLLAVSDTLGEALSVIPAPAKFIELSYIGQFPTYTDGKHYYQIQGLADIGVVCSLPKSDTDAYRKITTQI